MSIPDNCRIYWFSGTGNALSAARWIADQASSAGVPASVIPIEESGAAKEPVPADKTLVGFCYPTHGFAPPWIVLQFLWRFPRSTGASAFFVNTRAGIRLGPAWLPGASGLALWWPILLFALKGYRIRGSLPLDMPHSWLILAPPNPKGGIQGLTSRCERLTRVFTTALLEGRVYHRWSVWLTLPLDLALAPIVPLYVLVGRFVLGKLLFASSRCDSCRLCVRNCPVQAISIRNGRPYWKATCESCMRCMNICPKRAIETWGYHLIPITWGLLAACMALLPLDATLWLTILTPVVFPLYWLLHQLWRSRIVNAVFTFTSPSRLWGRYLARDIRVRDLTRPIKSRGE